MERKTITTQDDVRLAADFYPADGGRYAILLHMMPATKESWEPFAHELQARGIASLAFDQRGHGKSDGGPEGYKSFSAQEQQNKIFDVRAAWSVLEEMGAKPEKTAIIGASIGANLAIQHLSEHSSIPAGVALSPGLDYHGVKTEPFVQHLADDQHVLMLASKEDEYAFQSIKTLHQENAAQTELIEVDGLGHGTNMFAKDGDVLERVAAWIDERL